MVFFAHGLCFTQGKVIRWMYKRDFDCNQHKEETGEMQSLPQCVDDDVSAFADGCIQQP